MHNMIVEDEGFIDPDERFNYDGQNVQPNRGQATRPLAEFIDAHKRIRDQEAHFQLKEDRAPMEPLSGFILATYCIFI